MSGARTRQQRTRDTIVSAAAGLFLRNGFLGANMDEIAAAADVSKQTVYAHFHSKEGLFLDVVRGLTGVAGDRHQEQVADPEPERPIGDYLLEFAELQLTIVMTPRLMQLRRLVIGEAERFPELGRALHALGPGRSIERLSRAFVRYREAGQLVAGDIPAAASFFNWLVMGAPVNDAMLLGDDAILPASQVRSHAEESVRIFLAAYGTR
ncbi:TetR/AcrR family transcriptional regulator [Aminobacter sp. HY435]|uniref:TetR/AcrR family transcriptional regulator n=1 Tax=Aminobacter sp. HY435 TaxID=2970917 RepID=UPI0022B94684|nr:TetR/AcrR family transcriptional regulator [Aminobacter sp. HY435]